MNLTDPIFTDANAAREYLEATRWADGVVCPHCGGTEKCKKLEGKSHRPGLYQCGDCRQQFTVTVGTVFERSKVPLNKWLLATFMMASSKKGISAHQLHRQIGVTYKTAWFMFHRIREAMRTGEFGPMGGNGGAVEVDETYIGKKKDKEIKHGTGHKMAVLSLVERETGQSRSYVLDRVTLAEVVPIVVENIDKEARLYTDDSRLYRHAKSHFTKHQSVNHSSKEWGRGDVHTNTIEGFFSIFKRGMKGVYQHCEEQHLHRYVAEFNFRYSHRAALDIDDTARAAAILKGAEGKRLTYRRTNSVVA